MSRDRGASAATIALVLILVLTLPVGTVMGATSAKAVGPELVPTKVCGSGCDLASGATSSSSSELRGHGPPGPSTQTEYDEQLGITFAQSYTSLEYNVTAVEQTDPTLDTGPAYLLDGLSDNGFWYQVGLSYNWGPGQSPGTGFDMNYEVFDPYGNSIDPIQGGGIEQFSGPVHDGDTVVLNLYFNSGEVVMIAEDLNTGAYAEQTFSAEGGTYFAGLPDAVANSNGFFTGLMTEWYHGEPYYTNLAEAIYSTDVSVTSGWMWMDEWNPNNNAVVFAANATTASTFTAAPAALQEFSYNSTTEYADATQFITGALNSTSTGGTGGSGGTGGNTTTTSTNSSGTSQVTMTFSFSVQGGGSGYGTPVLTYTSGGTQETATLTTTPTAYKLDNGSDWSVSSSITSTDERLVTNETTTGVAEEGQTVSIAYQNQYYVTLTLNDASGGSVQPASGWYDAGQTLQISATANTGWKFEGWTTSNATTAGMVSSSSTSVTLTGPIDETAVFYPGLVVTAPSSASVTFNVVDAAPGESTEGTVQPGTTQSIYVAPSSEIILATSSTSFLYSSAWTVTGGSTSSTVAIAVFQPASIAPVSSVDYLNLGIVGGVLALVLIAIAAALAARRGQRTWTVEGQTTYPAPEDSGPSPPPDSQPPASIWTRWPASH